MTTTTHQRIHPSAWVKTKVATLIDKDPVVAAHVQNVRTDTDPAHALLVDTGDGVVDSDEDHRCDKCQQVVPHGLTGFHLPLLDGALIIALALCDTCADSEGWEHP